MSDKRLTRDERVQKIAQVIREWEQARHLWDEMTRVKFTVIIKTPPDEVAEAKGIVYGERPAKDDNDRTHTGEPA